MAENKSNITKEEKLPKFLKEKKSNRCNKKELNEMKFNKIVKFKNIIILMLIIINLSKYISPRLIENIAIFSKSSIIQLKIYGTGTQSVFNENYRNHPNKIYINGVQQSTINYEYSFNQTNNNVELEWNDKIKDCSKMFRDCSKIYEISFTYFDVSDITSISSLFYGCESLKSINLSNWNVKNIFETSELFQNCFSLTSIILPDLSKSRLILMYNMFYNCTSLLQVNLTNIDTSSVKYMGSLFSGCSSLTSIDMSHIDTSNALYIDSMFKGCKSLTSVNISHFKTPKVEILYDMFNGCELLTSIDLSNFDTSMVTDMKHMFDNCKSLISLNISNFDTSSVSYMNNMFSGCESITSLDLSKFDTSKVNNMEHMFDNCKSLSSLNLSNFKMQNIKTLNYMFNNCQNLEYINLQNSKPNATKIGLFNNTLKNLVLCLEYDIFKEYITDCNIIDCSENWGENRKKINLENNSCIDDCSLGNHKYEYLFKCYSSCPIGTYVNNFKCENCHPDCKTCDGPANINNTNCRSCLSPYKYLQHRNCVANCRNGYYTDENDSSIKICKCELDKCFKCSEESLSMNLCISCNDNFYPKSDELINNNVYINCYNNPESYYLDNNDLVYKPCYSTCKSCNKEGNELEHNCLECKSGYNISISLNGSTFINCYNECNYDYYLNGSDYYICTQNEYCLDNYNELFEEQENYFGENETDDIYINEYNKFCFIDYQSFKEERKISTFSNCLIWNDIERIYEGDNIIYQITTYKNQLLSMKDNSFNNNNLSIIDLNECEDILKEQYNIDNMELLIMIKQENKTNIASKKNVKFKLYESCSKTELNLSLCGDNKINIYTKVELSQKSKQLYEQLKDLGYNMFDINDKFYQDICTPYTTEENTDIILSDRINYIYNNNDTKCQANCEYYKYYVVEEYIYCTCIVKETTTDNNEENKFDENNLLFEVLKYSNYKILKCYNLVFTKNILKRNIGSIILFILFLIYLICFLIYIFQGIDPLKIKFFRSSLNNDKSKNIPDIKINFFVENKFLVNIGGLKDNRKEIKRKKKNNKNIINPPRKSSYNLNSHSVLRDINDDKNKINKNKKYKNKRRNKYSNRSNISRNCK